MTDGVYRNPKDPRQPSSCDLPRQTHLLSLAKHHIAPEVAAQFHQLPFKCPRGKDAMLCCTTAAYLATYLQCEARPPSGVADARYAGYLAEAAVSWPSAITTHEMVGGLLARWRAITRSATCGQRASFDAQVPSLLRSLADAYGVMRAHCTVGHVPACNPSPISFRSVSRESMAGERGASRSTLEPVKIPHHQSACFCSLWHSIVFASGGYLG